MLPPAAAANSVVQVDQMPARIARMRLDLLTQQSLCADLVNLYGIGG